MKRNGDHTMAAADDFLMRRALALAEATIGLASPNPQVGCVLTRDGQPVGEGAHLYDHLDHAEIVALKQAGPAARGATAYVTLEPCSHHGRTGPCADALIAAGIARCVVATVDPNPLVAGRGIARLRAAGIEVELGPGEARARNLNNAFACSITQHRPFVTLKSALSVDGRIAPPPSLRTPNQPYLITGREAREQVQRLRHAQDAILTGIGTVLADDPLLTDRTGLPRRRPLMRVVLDSRLQTPVSSKLVQTARQNLAENGLQDLWIFCGPDAPSERKLALEAAGVRVTAGSLDPREVLAQLHQAQLTSVLIEAGSGINGAFLRADLVDQAILFYAETELGPHAMSFAPGGLTSFALETRMLSVARRTFGADVCVSGLLHNPWARTRELEVSWNHVYRSD
jgi:diaminohydroxyphosphoribosylaminopyrimidine deaminase/5-amino-6-(5-phosphoribosylamino)uracil reductase